MGYKPIYNYKLKGYVDDGAGVPLIAQQPRSKKLMVTQDELDNGVSIYASCLGSNADTYQWFTRDDDGVADAAVGDIDSTVIITSNTVYSTQLFCEITNDEGTVQTKGVFLTIELIV